MIRRCRPPPPPAFLFFGIFGADREAVGDAAERIADRFGPFHSEGTSPWFDFPDTETYRESMGTGLERRFWVLAARWPQDGLARVKRATGTIEEEVAARHAGRLGVERPVNVDPGLVNDCRVILASTKDHAHRLYRGDSVWEEVTLVWRHGAYRALPWTYRDFAAPDYHPFFARFRREFLERARQEP